MSVVVIADDALAQLTARVRGEALVVMDSNTREVAGDRILGALRDSGARTEALLFDQRSGLLAGLEEVERVRSQLGPDTQPIAVGSGVITDIVRYAAHLSDRDFVSVPTAASMDGYASSVAALQLDGVKVSYPARAPVAIFADPRFAAAAPLELTRAGVGDLLAKATARVDWLASHLLYGEEFLPAVADRVLRPLSSAASHAAAIVSGDADAIRALLEGLIQSGLAMALAGSSRPASGCEHHASHFWDLLAARGLRSHASHGLQVGYATRFAMRLQRFAFAGGVPELRPPVAVADPLGPAAREWLGEPTAEIIAAVGEKQRFAAGVMSGDWPSVRRSVGPELERFDEIERALDLAGIPAEPGWLEIDERTLRATFRYASRLRARYTVIDFLEGQGMLDEALEAMLR